MLLVAAGPRARDVDSGGACAGQCQPRHLLAGDPRRHRLDAGSASAQLEKYFASGAIGLTADGLIEVRDQNAVPLAERATVKRLVAEDNADRKTLYAEIAKANGHPEWEADIRKTFARRWVERGAKPGWYYQDASGSWVQKYQRRS